MKSILREEVSAPSIANALLGEMLRRMLRIRLFEERVASLKASARMPGGVHLSIGQEAEIVGSCIALRDDDYMTGNHRSHGHPIGKGAKLAPLMAELFGKEGGVCRGKGGSMHLADFSVGSLGESGIVGGMLPSAVGAGLSAKLRGTDQVCLCFFGDGAANEGTFHESLNLAAVWKVPVIFLCENNGYAMFTSQAQSTSIANIADRASAYNIPGAVVDGQDVLAVYRIVSAAVARARAGQGPTLIEAKTYRYKDHSEFGGLKVARYRSDEEMATWHAKDPLQLFPTWLQSTDSITEGEIHAIRSAVEAEVEEAVSFAEQSSVPPPESLFEDLFA
jgi:acetoin:2,6-dichlorophenolindophenol oxidoreductase subunit alpha